jgi:hypothetical protein
MILMSDDLTDRIILEHDEETVTDASVATATFWLGSERLMTCPLTSFTFTGRQIRFTFPCVPSTALALATTADTIRCTLASGSHTLDYDVKPDEVTWEGVEGKQMCTIVTMIDKSRSAT